MELYGPCWESARIKKVFSGIDKSAGADTISVLNFANSIRIKVAINQEEIFMIFDTGASDVLVSKEVVAFSDSSGIHYLDEYYTYVLADGSEIEVQMATVDNFQIGKFRLENFKIAISDDVPSPLLGKSVLDLFSSWTVNADNQLILQP